MSQVDEQLRQSIRMMAQVVTEVCQDRTRQQICPLSRKQYYILKILDSDEQYQVSDFARLLGVSNAAASKNIDRLVGLGLVGRQTRPGDRRSQNIVLQDEGRRLVTRVDEAIQTKQDSVLAEFTEQEKVALRDLLRRYVKVSVSDDGRTDSVFLQCRTGCGDDCVFLGERGNEYMKS